MLQLTSPERQFLTRITKGCYGHWHPVGWNRERVRALLQCDERPEGEGRDETQLPWSAQRRAQARPSRADAAPTSWIASAKRRSCS